MQQPALVVEFMQLQSLAQLHHQQQQSLKLALAAAAAPVFVLPKAKHSSGFRLAATVVTFDFTYGVAWPLRPIGTAEDEQRCHGYGAGIAA